jgi:dihydropyrimidinase
VDYAFHVILTDVNPSSLSELPDLINQDGVSSFKMYMAYPGVLMVDDAAIFKTMRQRWGAMAAWLISMRKMGW